MAYDSATQQIVLFGGEGPNAGPYVGDTWTWNGVNWSQQAPSASPPAESFASVADDPKSGQLVLFGGINTSNQSFDYGYSSQTWTWDGTTWEQRTPATSPPPRAGGSMAYDPTTGDVILFGGVCTCYNTYNDTWAWTGTDWVQQSPPTSPPQNNATPLIYDSALGGLLLITSQDQTWLWVGGNWALQHPASSPPYEVEIGAQEPTTGEALVVGSNGGSSPQEQTWVYTKSPA